SSCRPACARVCTCSAPRKPGRCSPAATSCSPTTSSGSSSRCWPTASGCVGEPRRARCWARCSPRCRCRRCASTRSSSTRLTPRFYGAVALAVILFFYAANSEVVWLYLLAYWVAALVLVSFVYSAWNRGFSLDATLAGIRRASGFDAEGLAEEVAQDEPFELDRLRIKITIGSPRGTRGPARAYGKVGVTSMSIAAGVVPKSGGHTEQLLPQPSRRGPVEMSDWWLQSGDPLGLFKRIKRGKDGEVALVLPRFVSLRAQPLVREL